MTTAKKTALSAALLIAVAGFYMKPMCWWERHQVGFAFTRGSYRGVTLSFSDGEMLGADGKPHPAVLTTNGYVEGWFWFPNVEWNRFKKSENTALQADGVR